MNFSIKSLLILLLAVVASAQQLPNGKKMLVISVDGLDYRYLRDCDRLGLKIPHLRRLMKEGEMTDGIVGVFPSITWPSHTSLISGVAPREHGILGNRRPEAEGGDYYWDVSLLKSKTLLQAARDARLRTAAITWPVTVNAPVDFNLPEYFQRRNGGAMDLRSIESKATPGLVEKITAVYPSFAQTWMDDRARSLATRYLLKYERPDLLLLHFVDLDAEAHENGPFTREANAILERTDELIGEILGEVSPRGTVVAVVSDHGFERVDKVVDINALLKQKDIQGTVDSSSELLTTKDEAVASYLRQASKTAENGIGREIPPAELKEFAPHLADAAVAAFEPAAHFLFGPSSDKGIFTEPNQIGVHGLWPMRRDYRSALLLWGDGIKRGLKPEASMLTIAPRFARILGVPFAAATPGKK